VPAAEDKFARFIGLLAEQLDEHHLRGADLAAGLFVSRSVLDRFVLAAAGEPAGRLRRRILLERAAYQLRTTDAGVLDVAIAAGYSSHEAFSRAFRRAYGAAPTGWRCGRAPIHIASRSGVHFYPPAGIRLAARAPEDRMNFPAELADQHLFVLGNMIDSAAGLTDDQLDAPIELGVRGIDASPTIRSLLSRLVGQLAMWDAAIANERYDFTVEHDESIDSLRARLAVAAGSFAMFVRTASEQDGFNETFVDATGDEPYVFTAAGMVAHILTYAAYRRTLVCAALASAGAPDVADDPLTWFAP
jgi:AraC family transcriptional regulator